MSNRARLGHCCAVAFLLATQVGAGAAPAKLRPVSRKAAPPAAVAHVKNAPKKAPLRTPVKPGPVLQSLEVLPKSVSLEGPGARQLLVVTGAYSDGTLRDLSTAVKYAIENGKIAAVTGDGLITPVADGSATVKIYLGKVGVRVPVAVAASAASGPPSFMRDVVPLLTRSGCNSLSCHGSPVGKAGFKLSMYGFDPKADHEAIVKQDRTVPEKGKRVDLTAVDKSLVLAKPSMQVPHQGGMRFKPTSPEFRLLSAWLTAGAPMDDLDPLPVVSKLELLPGPRRLEAAGRTQRLVVMAHYSDGTSEDVTHKSIYTSNDDSVASVEDGLVTAGGSGETAILARYLGRVGTAQVMIPQPQAVVPADYAGFKPASFVDELSLTKWRQLNLVPSAPATDAEFLRRAYLDLIGTLPTADETRAFLSECAGEVGGGAVAAANAGIGEKGIGSSQVSTPKPGVPSPIPPFAHSPLPVAHQARTRLIERLLSRPEYADWWTLLWGDALRNNSRLIQVKGAQAYRNWIRTSIADNRPYDQFARELITASGGSFTSGPANFYRVARTPQDLAEQTAQVFLGVRLQCANCHNHPFEKWTRTSYHRFAALFSRTSTRNMAANEIEVIANPKGSYKHPETNRALEPAVLEDTPAELPADREWRDSLADWLVSPQNGLFARNLVNRVWAQMFGRGIVEPVDDVRATNPPVNEPLLDALAQDFIAHKFDVKHLIRTIANSATYQLSVRANRWNAKDRQNFSRAYHRRIKAEPLLDAICQVTDQPETFQNHPAGTRAIQLVDNRAASYFMDIFGRPRREVVCSCEREETANLTQALHLINGETINRKIGSPKGRLAALLDPKSGKSAAEIVEELYLWCVSRRPTPDETADAVQQLEAAGSERRAAAEDLLWVLLNSTEFQFNH